MLYRDQFINSLPTTDTLKSELIEHMNNMTTKALIYRLVEILNFCLEPDCPPEIKQRAAGASCVLHQYHSFDWDLDDLYDVTLQVLRTHYPDTHKIWEYYADRSYWSVKRVGTYYNKIEDLENFTEFEAVSMKHRSYTFILYEILKDYMCIEYKDAVYQGLYELQSGLSYFYDVVKYWTWQHEHLDLNLARFSELRTLEIMKQNEYDVSGIDYLTLQNYVLATGEYEFFLEQARLHYQKSFDTFNNMKSGGGRIRVIKGLIRYCDTLLSEAEKMFKK